MKARTRDFIHTKEDLYFATTNYIHPKDRIISFLRYIPDKNGDREKNGKKYRKVSSDEAYSYLREKYPEYLYFCDVTNIEMMGVPYKQIKEIIKPEKRLVEIRKEFEDKSFKTSKNSSNTDFYKKLVDLSDFFHYIGGIDYKHLGISGSILPNLQKSEISDLDFVVFGLKNHKKAVETFEKYKNKTIEIKELKKTVKIHSIGKDFWNSLYEKRIKDDSLTMKEFSFYESRKSNRGVIENTLFDILATRNWNEIKGVWGGIKYKSVGKSTIECEVKNAIGSYDNPAVYKIANVEVLDGDNFPIEEIASFTHTYAGQARDGEKIIAKGKVEMVCEHMKEKYYRLVIGTTRESIGEYIKLKNEIY
ncbi:DNA polymerase subunit beta [Methanobrevibacter curvatus]|nr:DNA polymerase subunit beta [Methanobrevibacter curvatus]